jgi:hypothetical protein
MAPFIPKLPLFTTILSGMEFPEKSDIVAVPIGDILRNPDYHYWERLINRSYAGLPRDDGEQIDVCTTKCNAML